MPGPPILYGTAWKKDRTAELVRTALALGFRGIDTACQPKHYDEAGVGAGIAASGIARGELFLQTKFTPLDGHDPRRIPYDPRTPVAAQVAQSFAVSQQNLRTPVVDSLVLHSPYDTLAETRVAWGAMEALVDAGGVRQLGIANCYDLEELRALWTGARIKPAVVQNRFHAQTGYDRGLRAFCRSQGIVYQSFWTLTANPHVLAHRDVRGLAQQHGRTPAQVLFRYLAHEGVVPLTGTTSETHMREDLAILDFELTPDERARIDGLLR